MPADYAQRARDKLRKLRQTGSVSCYLIEFGNVVFTIPGMNENEKFYKFIQRLKHEVKLEVLKRTAANFEETARISLRVGSVLWNSKSQCQFSSANRDSQEIVNFQKDIENNACFTCHIPGCRPWKHRQPETYNITSNESGTHEELDNMSKTSKSFN